MTTVFSSRKCFYMVARSLKKPFGRMLRTKQFLLMFSKTRFFSSATLRKSRLNDTFQGSYMEVQHLWLSIGSIRIYQNKNLGFKLFQLEIYICSLHLVPGTNIQNLSLSCILNVEKCSGRLNLRMFWNSFKLYCRPFATLLASKTHFKPSDKSDKLQWMRESPIWLTNVLLTASTFKLGLRNKWLYE